jgi:hypothetical protein
MPNGGTCGKKTVVGWRKRNGKAANYFLNDFKVIQIHCKVSKYYI